MKRKLAFFLTFILILMTAACSGETENQSEEQANDASETETFKIGAIPDQNASELNRSMDLIADYLATETGLEVEYVPSVDYAALVTAFERGEIHLAWFGGLTGVQARSLVDGSEAIAQRPRDEEFTSVFIAQKELQVQSLEELKGLSFTFGSESSTSGHLMPRYFLMENGIDPENDFDGEPQYSGSHDKTYKFVEAGTFQAGALNEAVWEGAVEDGNVDLDKVEVFYTTPTYYDYNWTVNTVDDVFGEGTKEKVKEAIFSMNEEQHGEMLDIFETEKFIETNNENYASIEKVAKELGIIK